MSRLLPPTWGVLLIAAMCACAGPSSSSAPKPAGLAIAPGAGCADELRQDLTFSGAMVGHLVCDAGQPVCDFVFAGRKTDTAFTGAIHAVAGGKPILLSFEVAPFAGPGSYGSVNQEGGNSINLDGPTHWSGQLGDPVVVTTMNQAILTGSLDSTLTSRAAAAVHVKGRWACDRMSSGR